jgi:hypothetical protein
VTDAPRLPFTAIREQVETSLGGTLEDLYGSFEQEPLATASIAQTHRARPFLGDMMSEASGIGSMLRTVPGQIDQLMHDFETGNIMVRAVTPELDRIPRHLHALGGRLSLAAFASATTIATTIAVPETTESTPLLRFFRR